MCELPSSPVSARLEQIEHLIRRDPARRGLIEADAVRGPLCPGHLAAAAEHLARFGVSAGIVTGFYIAGANPPAAETDGPPGAALLGATLLRCGMSVRIITDESCAPAVSAAAAGYEMSADTVLAASVEASRKELTRLLYSLPQPLTHLIAVERVGPAYTCCSYAGARGLTAPAVARFQQLVPPEHQNRCHNMRGEIIDGWTAPLHELFEITVCELPTVRTIGIGDGGNEIGMGSVPWEELSARLSGPMAAVVPCRIPADWTIVAGVSNWGAQALAAAVCLLRNRPELLADFSAASEEQRLKDLVERGPAVDGVTRLCEPTVDGLPFLTYIQPWQGMRRILGLDK